MESPLFLRQGAKICFERNPLADYGGICLAEPLLAPFFHETVMYPPLKLPPISEQFVGNSKRQRSQHRYHCYHSKNPNGCNRRPPEGNTSEENPPGTACKAECYNNDNRHKGHKEPRMHPTSFFSKENGIRDTCPSQHISCFRRERMDNRAKIQSSDSNPDGEEKRNAETYKDEYWQIDCHNQWL